jgi:peptide/nickel transport system substrate-binding protein
MSVSSSVKTVRIGVVSSISKLDPRDSADHVSSLLLAQIFDTPYVGGEGGVGASPCLFEPLKQESLDGLQYSAAVRPGIRFSEGTPLTADIAARALRGAGVLANRVTIDVRGDRVWFTLAARNPRFELTLAQSGCAIVLDKGLQFHGTGPFMFEQRPNLRLLQTANSIRLVRNPQYRGQTLVDEVEFVVLPADADGTPRKIVDAMRKGEIDLTTSLPVSDLSVHQLTGFSPVVKPSNSTAMLFFNCERRLLRETFMRRGIAAALDVHEIASKSYDRNPMAFVAGSVLPPSMWRSTTPPTADLREAARLIEAAGGKGARLTLTVPWAVRPYLPRPMAAAEVIRKQLAAVGIDLSIVETKSSGDFMTTLATGRFDLALAGWIADTTDPADFYEALFWSRSIGDENGSNNSRWNDPRTDAALTRFRVQPSEENRRDIENVVRDEAPLVPLIYGQSTVIHARRLRNVTISPIGILPLNDISM